MTDHKIHIEQQSNAHSFADIKGESKNQHLAENLQWIEALYFSITEMGKLHTNPVKLMLGNITSIKPFQHYPQNAYLFGNKYWRAYYHSHNSPLNLEQEHGHLHFFTRNAPCAVQNNDSVNTPESNWAHCFALSINPLGQPVYMFTTNLWVTRGEWLNADSLALAMKFLAQDKPDSIILNWFWSFILAFQDDIRTLLVKRDDAVSIYCNDDIEKCHEDKNLYQLSILPVHLQNKLRGLLLAEPRERKLQPHS